MAKNSSLFSGFSSFGLRKVLDSAKAYTDSKVGSSSGVCLPVIKMSEETTVAVNSAAETEIAVTDSEKQFFIAAAAAKTPCVMQMEMEIESDKVAICAVGNLSVALINEENGDRFVPMYKFDVATGTIIVKINGDAVTIVLTTIL